MTNRSRRLSSIRSYAVLGAIVLAAGFVACATLPVVPIDEPEDGAVPEASADVQADGADGEAAVDAGPDADAASDASLDVDADADAGPDAEDEDADAA